MARPVVYLASSVAFLMVTTSAGGTPDLTASLELSPSAAAYKRLAYGLKAQKIQLEAKLKIEARQTRAARFSFGALRAANPLWSVPVVLEGRVEGAARAVTLKQGEVLRGTVQHHDNHLAHFHKKLDALKAKKSGQQLTILHIGGGHVAADAFSKHIRSALQTRYGNAGRGMAIPAAAFRGASADGLTLKVSSGWRSETAAKRNAKKKFGLSGVRVSADSTESFMTMQTNRGRFDWAEVTVATGPHKGAMIMTIGKHRKRFNAFSKRTGSKTIRMRNRGKKVTIRPDGIGVTTILNWATGNNRNGVRYVNFGLNGSSAYVANRFNAALLKRDVKQLNPDLIIFGHGTNEGFDNRLNVKHYQRFVARYTKQLKSYAPNADLVFIGAASGLRKKGGKQCGAWSIPPKLNPMRDSIRELAKAQKAGFWDWSSAMGGDCGINEWASKGLASKGRVRLTPKGYKRSAQAFVKWLTAPQEDDLVVAEK